MVIDNALANPELVVAWASEQPFGRSEGNAYPGLIAEVSDEMARSVVDLFERYARSVLGGRRTLRPSVRLSLMTLQPDELAPVQWQCHRDRLASDPESVLMAAMVLYLYRDPRLGGTAFYRPLAPPGDIERMLTESRSLSAGDFRARYDVNPGYLDEGNRYFGRIAQVESAWNRAIFYDGGQFHSPVVHHPELLTADARTGRLTLNGFFVCSRRLG